MNRQLVFDKAAIRHLEKARGAFVRLGMPEELILVSLELALVLDRANEQDKLEELRNDTLRKARATDPFLIKLIHAWQVALSGDGLADCYQAAVSRLLSSDSAS